MDLHEKNSKTRNQFPLNSKKIWERVFTQTGVWVWFCLAFGFFVDGFAATIAFLFFIPLTWLYEDSYFNSYFYEMGDDFFMIRSGVFTTHELVMLYNRIQDIYIDQGLFDHLFGLYDVHISSATEASGPVAHIDGLTKADAEGLRNALLDAARNAKQQ